MLPADDDGELTVADGGTDRELYFLEHILGKYEIVAVPVIADHRLDLIQSVLEVELLKIVRCLPDSGRGLAGPGLEAGSVVVGDTEYYRIRVAVLRVCVSIGDPVRHF